MNQWVPPRPHPGGRLAKMDGFWGQGKDMLDVFFENVDELADFCEWDE